MENAADALKMAAAILIFIIAIASSFSLFGTAKQTADSIIGMRDKQAYLEAAELDNGILYTSSSAIKGNNAEDEITTEYVSGVTKNGDRVVGIDDVISTIYRYAKEKYGVTIVQEDGKVLARFSTATESRIANYNAYNAEWWKDYTNLISLNIKTDYVENLDFGSGIQSLYGVSYYNGSSGPDYDAKWLGSHNNIQKRIICDIYGGNYDIKDESGKLEQRYEGKKLIDKLTETGKKIIEVTNEIDQSKYLKDGDNATNLPQQYEMPTVEIVYIIIE